MRFENTELRNKREETKDYNAHLKEREHESQQIHHKLKTLSNQPKGHDMAELNPMVGGY